MDTVPAPFRGRTLYRHNQNVTLMRTTPDENERMGRWIGERLNQMDAPVRFLLPEGVQKTRVFEHDVPFELAFCNL